MEDLDKIAKDVPIESGTIQKNFDIEKYADFVRLVTRDLNDHRWHGSYVCNFFGMYTKEKIIKYLSHPKEHEKELRHAVNYVYNASPHFRRLIEYFVGLSDLCYVVSPYRVNPKKSSSRIVGNNYRKTLSTLSIMSIKTQFPKILSVCLREDVFYGTMWISDDTITIQQLPSDYCAISAIEGNVCNVSFDFSYFDTRKHLLSNYPAEFAEKYNTYRNEKNHHRWIELSAPTSFAIKANTDFLDFAIPPFAGILPEIFDIENYKQLRMDGAELENYAMLGMYIPMSDKGEWG